MTNYIEIRHNYSIEEPGIDDHAGDTWIEDGVAVWYATSPNIGHWDYYRKGVGPHVNTLPLGTRYWEIKGTTLTLYNIEDIRALRKLLDAIEIEITKEED